jgi:hypothetical protein
MTRAPESKESVSLGRRVKWCRQIVQGVASVHCKIHVVGCFSDRPSPKTGIDEHDDAFLIGQFVRHQHVSSHLGMAVVPAEIDGTQCDSYQATAAIDIYQLGVVLWGITVDRMTLSRYDFCELHGCDRGPFDVCNEVHADPVELPIPEALPVPQCL